MCVYVCMHVCVYVGMYVYVRKPHSMETHRVKRVILAARLRSGSLLVILKEYHGEPKGLIGIALGASPTGGCADRPPRTERWCQA